MHARWALAIGSAILVVASGTQAAIVWSSESTLVTSVVSPSVTLGVGTGASKERFVDGVAVSANKTRFAANLHGWIGASADVKDVIRLYNNGTGPRTVTLRGTQVTDPSVISLEWLVKDGPITRATLDMRDPNPSASFSAEPSTIYKLQLKFKVARGPSASDAAFSTGVWSVLS